MAKLYFRYGAVGSGKTHVMLSVAHTYEQQGKRVFVMKPSIDTRFGAHVVQSRSGWTRDADFIIENEGVEPFELLPYLANVQCILVDEAQFLNAKTIDTFRNLTLTLEIPVICYGLRTNFKSHLFEGAQRLLELADTIEEIKTTCMYCNRKAIFNYKRQTDGSTHNCSEDAEIDLGFEEKYHPTCAKCFGEHAHFFGNLE